MQELLNPVPFEDIRRLPKFAMWGVQLSCLFNRSSDSLLSIGSIA